MTLLPATATAMTHILVTTGPESSGKTTLAMQLSDTLMAPLVNEASRSYLTRLYSTPGISHYQESDLAQIAMLQHQQELAALQAGPAQLVLDTDLLVIIVWSEAVYGRVAPRIRELFEQSRATTHRSYLLCTPDIPWLPDPLRENPHDRARLFDIYQDKINQLGLNSLTVQGSEAERLALVQHYLTNNPLF